MEAKYEKSCSIRCKCNNVQAYYGNIRMSNKTEATGAVFLVFIIC